MKKLLLLLFLVSPLPGMQAPEKQKQEVYLPPELWTEIIVNTVGSKSQNASQALQEVARLKLVNNTFKNFLEDERIKNRIVQEVLVASEIKHIKQLKQFLADIELLKKYNPSFFNNSKNIEFLLQVMIKKLTTLPKPLPTKGFYGPVDSQSISGKILQIYYALLIGTKEAKQIAQDLLKDEKIQSALKHDLVTFLNRAYNPHRLSRFLMYIFNGLTFQPSREVEEEWAEGLVKILDGLKEIGMDLKEMKVNNNSLYNWADNKLLKRLLSKYNQ